MPKKNKRNTAGGQALASVKGYHALLSARSHGTISKTEFNLRKVKLLAKLKRHA